MRAHQCVTKGRGRPQHYYQSCTRKWCGSQKQDFIFVLCVRVEICGVLIASANPLPELVFKTAFYDYVLEVRLPHQKLPLDLQGNHPGERNSRSKENLIQVEDIW